MQANPKGSGDPQTLAIAALVCSVMGAVICLPTLPGIVMGHIARARGKRTAERRGVGLATAALVIGYGSIVSTGGFLVAKMPSMLAEIHAETRNADFNPRTAKLDSREDVQRAAALKPVAQVERGPLPESVRARLPAHPAASKPKKPAQRKLSWSDNEYLYAPKTPAAELVGCVSDKKKMDWERSSCLIRLARNDRARASALAAELLASGVIRKLDVANLHAVPKDMTADGVKTAVEAKLLAEYPTLQALEQRLKDVGLLPNSEREPSEAPPVTIEELLEAYGRHASFDVETGSFPNQHDLLARDLARLTDLDADAILFEEVAPPDSKSKASYQLRAYTSEYEYRVVAENLGDWYDVGAVLRLLDRLLADAGSELRMTTLPTTDQAATVIAVPPAALAAAQRLGLLYTESSTAPEQRGKAFEAKVLEYMQRHGAAK